MTSVKKGSAKRSFRTIKVIGASAELRRLSKRYQDQVPAGLIHQARGKKSPRSISSKLQKKVNHLWEHKCRNFGPTFLSEKLRESEKIFLSKETLRKWVCPEQKPSWRRCKRPHRL